jgi:hypothetical protein
MVKLGEKKAYDHSPQGRWKKMADRKQFLRIIEPDQELARILEQSKANTVSEAELKEQRISFAYGNAPHGSEHRITKESVKAASEHIKLLP